MDMHYNTAFIAFQISRTKEKLRERL